MKLNLRHKLAISYILVIITTLLLFAIISDQIVIREFREFYQNVQQQPGGPQKPPRREDVETTLRTSLILTVAGAATFGILISMAMSKYVTDPLRAVMQATKDIARGQIKKRLPITSQDELGELTLSVNEMAESIESHRQMQQNLIANVSHELGTPLTNIAGYTEALHDELITNPQKQKETYQLILSETERLKAMLEEVRTLSLIEQPQFQIHRKPTDIKQITQTIIKSMNPTLKRKQLTLTTKTDELKNPTISIDPYRYKQILTNLLSNAIKFTPEKSQITIELATKENDFVLTITDTGQGIPTEDLPHIFDRFYQANKSRQRKEDTESGTGLGLTIVKELVEAHEGSIAIESVEGEGTTVRCRFGTTHSHNKSI